MFPNMTKEEEALLMLTYIREKAKEPQDNERKLAETLRLIQTWAGFGINRLNSDK